MKIKATIVFVGVFVLWAVLLLPHLAVSQPVVHPPSGLDQLGGTVSYTRLTVPGGSLIYGGSGGTATTLYLAANRVVYGNTGGSAATAPLAGGLGVSSGTITNSFTGDISVTAGGSVAIGAGKVDAYKLGYAPDSMVLVQRGSTNAVSGANLVAAYGSAKSLLPGGASLSTLNRSAVIIPPGTYLLPASGSAPGLTLDGEYVDLDGAGIDLTVLYYVPAGTTSTTVGPGVRQTALDLRLSDMTIRSGTFPGDALAYRTPAFEVVSLEVETATDGFFANVGKSYPLPTLTATTVLAAVGDWAEMYHTDQCGTMGPPRSWPIDTAVNAPSYTFSIANLGTVAPASFPAFSGLNNVIYTIRRTNKASRYDRVAFEVVSDSAVSQYKAGAGGGLATVWGNGHIDGTWTDCIVRTSGGWNVGPWCHVLGTWRRCQGGQIAWLNDGSANGGGNNANLGTFAYVSASLLDCVGGSYSVGAGCETAGCPVTKEAVIQGGSFKAFSISQGREMAGRVSGVIIDGPGIGARGSYTDVSGGTCLVGCVTGTVEDVTVSAPGTVGTVGPAGLGGGPLAVTWVAETLYPIGYVAEPTTPNGYRYVMCHGSAATYPGVSGVSEPTWPTRVGWMVHDNTCQWQAVQNRGTFRNVTLLNSGQPIVTNGGTVERCHFTVAPTVTKPVLYLMADGIVVLNSALIPGGGTTAIEATAARTFIGAGLYLPGGTSANVSTTVTNPYCSGF